MELFAEYLPNFFFIFIRAGIVVALLPFLGSANIPPRFKIGFAAGIALVLTPVVDFTFTTGEIPRLIFREVAMGAAISAAAWAVFFAVEMAGQMMSTSMGLSMATVMNPEIGPSTEISRLFSLLTMLVFLSLDAHHELIVLFVRSYDLVLPGAFDVRAFMSPLLSMTGGIFALAVKISAPVVAVMLITNLLFGFLYKAAPQMNVFFVGYPVYLFVGFLVMLAGAPVFVHLIAGSLGGMRESILQVFSTGGR